MKVLFVAPELPPYAKVGGLGDVVCALSKALRNLGIDARVFCPLYGGIFPSEDWQPHPSPLHIRLGTTSSYGRLWETNHTETGVPVAFLEFNQYFERDGIYGPPDGGHSFGDNGERFTFFSRASIDYCHHINWLPNVIHCHDWTTGLLPSLLDADSLRTGWNPATVFTLHNMEHQGVFGVDVAEFAGINFIAQEPAPYLNFLSEGITRASALTTVSPTYAKEIQYAPGGCGLESLLKSRSKDLKGILNGIDLEAWNPFSDPSLPKRFSADNQAGKTFVKTTLQEEMNLPSGSDFPLFGVVSRFYSQKGLDLLAECLPKLLSKDPKAQFVILGSGDPAQEDTFQSLAKVYTSQVAVVTRFDERLARCIYGGSDFFIMPSRFEPCGLGQLYAMRYGSIPIARRTGGLVDTIKPIHKDSGTGILFDEPTSGALFDSLELALGLYNSSDLFQSIRKNAMSENFGWDISAGEYRSLYQKLTEAQP